MKVLRLACRQEQASLLNEERTEMRAMLEIEHEGNTGFLRMDCYYEKRDAETEYYCDVPGVTTAFIADTDWCWMLDERVWSLAPETTTPTSAIRAEIERLGSHLLKSCG